MRERRKLNLNNITRTNYYLQFWQAYPEIPWALLAHLVSRNAGYQMSDIARYKEQTILAMAAANVYPALPTSSIDGVALGLTAASFALLEEGNFLIFRDIYPQLEAYALAKQNPPVFDVIFDALAQDSANFDIDQFAVDQWKEFFNAAQGSAFFLPNWWESSQVQQHSFALICNEQNQIEDRLVNDPNHRYLGWGAWPVGKLVQFFNYLGWTRLAFPEATSGTNVDASKLLRYVVTDFSDLDVRISVGRDLYMNLFWVDGVRRDQVVAWATGHPDHRGSRTDYNATDYSTDWISVIPGGRIYSPTVVDCPGYSGAWPVDASTTWPGSVLHADPIPLPKGVYARQDASGTPSWNTWVSHLEHPAIPVMEFNLSDLAEIVQPP